MNQIILISIFLFLVVVLLTIFGKSLEHYCTGRAARFLEPPNKGLCLHPYLFCGIKSGGRPGENWYL
jgi:hypothetical protein